MYPYGHHGYPPPAYRYPPQGWYPAPYYSPPPVIVPRYYPQYIPVPVPMGPSSYPSSYPAQQPAPGPAPHHNNKLLFFTGLIASAAGVLLAGAAISHGIHGTVPPAVYIGGGLTVGGGLLAFLNRPKR